MHDIPGPATTPRDRPAARRIRTPWLDARRGYLSDWITQRWVRRSGRPVELAEHPWLDSPPGSPRGIGGSFFADHARTSGLVIEEGDDAAGLLESLDVLAGPGFDPRAVHPSISAFYERTAAWEMDAWSEWCGPYRFFGWLLRVLFSRRLQQLNVPLSPLDTSRGVTSEIVRLRDPATGAVRITAWIRHLVRTGDVLYAGSYSVARVPGHDGPCVRVAFPLPNGNAFVIMRPEALSDASLTITSAGRAFGDPGFYFTVVDSPGRVYALYLPALRESIHVFAADDGGVRADHRLDLFGRTFLRIHYRLRRRAAFDPGAPPLTQPTALRSSPTHATVVPSAVRPARARR